MILKLVKAPKEGRPRSIQSPYLSFSPAPALRLSISQDTNGGPAQGLSNTISRSSKSLFYNYGIVDRGLFSRVFKKRFFLDHVACRLRCITMTDEPIQHQYAFFTMS